MTVIREIFDTFFFQPPFSSSRFISAIMVGYLWGQLIMLAIPENEVAGINWNFYLHWLIPLAVGLGIYAEKIELNMSKISFFEESGYIHLIPTRKK